MTFKMKGFSGFGNSPAKYEKDPKEFTKRKSKEGLQTKVNIGPKVDPDAPGTPGKPGYEPSVKRSDLDEKGKKIYDLHRKKGPVKPKPGEYEKYSDLEKYDDDRPSPNKKRGLWDNIHAKRKRGEKMRKPGSKGAPTDKALKESQSPNKLLGIKKKADAARKSLGNAAGIPGDPVA